MLTATFTARAHSARVCRQTQRSPAITNPWRAGLPQLSQQQLSQHAHLHQHRQRSSSKVDSSSDPRSTLATATDGKEPWVFIYDTRASEIAVNIWNEELQGKLITIVAANKLSVSTAQLEERLDTLVKLAPDLGKRVHTLKPKLLAQLLENPSRVAASLLALKEAMPTANVSLLAANEPRLLLQDSLDLRERVLQLQALLGVEDVGRLVQDMPAFLDVEHVEEALRCMRDLMPNRDVVAMLVADPPWMLRVDRGEKWLGENPQE